MKPTNSHSIVFILSTVSMIALAVAGFLVPPMGVIDGSVLHSMSLLCVPLVISQIRPILRDGRNFRLQHGETTVEIKGKQEEN